MTLQEKAVFAMLHVNALPGTPNYKGNMNSIINKTIKEAETYSECGVKHLIIENMHDVPYLKKNVGPEITAAMSVIGYEIKKKIDVTCGIQILAGANKEALASAHAANLDFIRAEGFVFSHVADEGIMESDAGELLRYRKNIGADQIKIFTDIKKKHSSHEITKDVSLVETAKAAQFFLSDGVIITGESTGKEASKADVEEVKNSVNIPVLIGSGITNSNIHNYYNLADGFIIGSYFKKENIWYNEIEPEKVSNLLATMNSIKNNN